MDTAITDIERSADAEQDLRRSAGFGRARRAFVRCPSAGMHRYRCHRVHLARLETQDTSTVYQRHDSAVIALSTLERECGSRPFIVAGHIEGRPAFLLPLVVKGRIYPTAQWIGGSHVNLCMGLYSREFLSLSTPGDIAIILRKVGALSNAYVMRLCCQPEAWNGHADPMAALERRPSINPAFRHASFGRVRGPAQARQCQAQEKEVPLAMPPGRSAGGYKLIVADDPKTVTRLLEAFFRQKGERLRKSGIHNVFNTSGRTGDAFHAGIEFARPATNRCFACMPGDRRKDPRRVRRRHKGRHLSGYFSSISEDELSDISPGEMLLYLLAEHCCSDGIEFHGSGQRR